MNSRVMNKQEKTRRVARTRKRIRTIMIRSEIINVIVDMENFLDSLLTHTEEENCQHSVSDFLQEYFDKKNGRISGLPNSIQEHSTKNSNLLPTNKEGGD